MHLIFPNEKMCPNGCGKLEPVIYANPDHDPRKLGNPWQCPVCGEIFGCKDGTSYLVHVQLVRQKIEQKESK